MSRLYVNNSFSTKMLKDGGDVHIEIITESEFRTAIQVADEVVIGHEDTATYFGVPYNRKTIHLEKGDVLYICEANNKEGGRLPEGVMFIEQMGEGFFFRFLKLEVR